MSIPTNNLDIYPHNMEIKNIFFVKHVPNKKLIGIEMEFEGTFLFTSPTQWWSLSKDDSLRRFKGHLPQEYVLSYPIEKRELDEALSYLLKRIGRAKTELNLSERCSTHVHLNVQSWTMKQVITLIILYLIFEDILVDWCGRHRVGNLFCLRARDATNMVSTIRRILQEAEEQQSMKPYLKLRSDNLRYTSCNVAALGKFGSLEWRALRGTNEQTVISQWVNILCSLHEMSLNFANPAEVIQIFESHGPKQFTEMILGAPWEKTDNLHDRLWDSVRNIRELAFASKWADDTKTIVKKPRIKRVKVK